MHTPPDEGPLGAAGIDDPVSTDLGAEAPAHPHDDAVVVDDDARPAATEAEDAEHPAAPGVVAEPDDPTATTDGIELTEHELTVPPRRIPATWMVALFVVVTGFRYWFSSNRRMFHIAIDEPAQLAIGRFVSGGTRWNLFDHSTWRPGMGTLLAPIFWFTDDYATIMHAGLMLEEVLGAAAAVVLALLALRITPLSPAACVIASLVIALAPASLSATAYVWAEGLVTLTFLGALLLTIDFYDTGRRGAGTAAIIVSVLGVTAHGRLMPYVVLVSLGVIGRSLAKRQWRQAVVHAVVAVGWTVLAFAYTSWIFSRVWDKTGSSNTIGTVVERLPRVVDNLQSAVGQTWYQFVATAGIAAVGLAVAFAASIVWPGVVSSRNARIVLLYTLPLVVVSIVFMSGRTRSDHRVYGRYNDAVMWPLLILGIAWLLDRTSGLKLWRRLFAAVAVIGLTGTATWALDRWHGAEWAKGVGVRPMIAGFAPVIGTANEIPAMKVTVFGMAGLLVLLVLSALPKRGVILSVVAVAFLGVSGYRTHQSLNTRLNSWEPAAEVAAIEDLVPPGEVLGVKFVPDAEHPKVKWDDQRRRLQIYQFALPDRLVVRDAGVDDAVGPYVFAPIGDKELAAAGAKVLWKDPSIMYGLWQEPDPAELDESTGTTDTGTTDTGDTTAGP